MLNLCGAIGGPIECGSEGRSPPKYYQLQLFDHRPPFAWAHCTTTHCALILEGLENRYNGQISMEISLVRRYSTNLLFATKQQQLVVLDN